MDLIARTITTPRGISRLSFIVCGLTTLGIFAFGIPPGTIIYVGLGGPVVLGALEPWAERRLARRH
jgi:hypothetical protein